MKKIRALVLSFIFAVSLFGSCALVQAASSPVFAIDNVFLSDEYNNRAYISMLVKENTEYNETAKAVLGFFGEGNELINIALHDISAESAVKQVIPITDSVDVPQGKSINTVKAFMLADYENLLPLSGVYEYSVGQSNSVETVIYIDPDYAGGSSDGTQSKPYTSWVNAAGGVINSKINLKAGYVYLQKRGTQASVSNTIALGSGTIMGAYGEGSKPIVNSGVNNSSYAIAIDKVSNAKVQDIHVVANTAYCGILAKGDSSGSVVYGGQVIERCEIEGSTYGVRGMDNLGGFKILYSKIHDTIDDGMFFNSGNVEIGYCHVYNVNMGWHLLPNGHDQTVSGGDNIQFAYNCDNVYIHHNVLDHSSTGNKFNIIMATDVAGTVPANNVIIEYNHLIHDKDFSEDVSDYTCHNIYIKNPVQPIIRHNIIEGAKVGIKNVNEGIPSVKTGTMQVYNNLFSDMHQVMYSSRHVNFYNNTIVDTVELARGEETSSRTSYKYGVRLDSAAGDPASSFKNNIWYLTDEDAGVYWMTGGSYESDYNVLYPENTGMLRQGWGTTTYSTLASWKTATGKDVNSVSINPLFEDAAKKDYRLKGASPLKGAGTAIPGVTGTGMVDIGCDYGALMNVKISDNPDVYLKLKTDEAVPAQGQSITSAAQATANVNVTYSPAEGELGTASKTLTDENIDFSFKMRMNDAPDASGNLSWEINIPRDLSATQSTIGKGITIRILRNGKIQYYDGSTQAYAKNAGGSDLIVEQGQIIYIRGTLNFGSAPDKTYTLFINEAAQNSGNPIKFNHNATADFDVIGFYTGAVADYKSISIDDIKFGLVGRMMTIIDFSSEAGYAEGNLYGQPTSNTIKWGGSVGLNPGLFSVTKGDL